MDEIDEGNSSTVTATFSDENGDAVTPTAGTVRIDDKVTKTAIRAAGAYTPTSETHDFTITATENRLLSTSTAYEDRVVTVTWTYGAGKSGAAEYEYRVKSLRFHSVAV